MNLPSLNITKLYSAIIAALLLIAVNTCFAQTDSLVIKAKRLRQLYNLSVNSTNGDIYKEQFFNEFPDTFKQLKDLYSNDDKKQGPLYNDAVGHIYELFNHIDNVSDTLYYKKLISISTGGHAEADAVSYFTDGLRLSVLNKTELTVFLLKNKADADVVDFWAFYFDYENSFSRKRNYDQIIKQLPHGDKKMASLVTSGYNKATTYWKDNH